MENEVLPSFSIGQLREMAEIDAGHCIGDDFMMFDEIRDVKGRTHPLPDQSQGV